MSQHALQELKQLTGETAKMEKEKRTLRDSRAEQESIRYKNKLQLTAVTSHRVYTTTCRVKMVMTS